jgi:hypothetical protein
MHTACRILVQNSGIFTLLLAVANGVVTPDQFNSSLFWSYYQSPGTVERAGVSQGAYERSSPALWSGPTLSNAYGEDEELPAKGDILPLGEFLKISHGPRRRRRDSGYLQNVTLTLAGPTLLHLNGSGAMRPQFRRYETPHAIGAGQSGGFVWPVKYSQANIEPPPVQKAAVADTEPRQLPRAATLQRSIAATAPASVCRHYCGPLPSSTPCCQPSYPFHTAGQLVQPTLLENWVSGVFEFGAQNPVVFALAKSVAIIGLLAIVLIIWGLLGEWLGFAEIPRARISLPSADVTNGKDDPGLARFVVDVVGGHWLEALEEHVVKNKLSDEAQSFLCCLYQDQERLECLPRTGYRGQHQQEEEEDQLTCLSNRVYDIALNLKILKNKKKP